jgi:hypothetical protein
MNAVKDQAGIAPPRLNLTAAAPQKSGEFSGFTPVFQRRLPVRLAFCATSAWTEIFFEMGILTLTLSSRVLIELRFSTRHDRVEAEDRATRVPWTSTSNGSVESMRHPAIDEGA